MSMTSSDEASALPHQHANPCHDCPFRRNAIAGWLGDSTPEGYIALAHSETIIDCHALVGPREAPLQCAGVAIYRANTLKFPPRGAIVLPKDKERVFETPMEFLAHHNSGPPFVKRKAARRKKAK